MTTDTVQDVTRAVERIHRETILLEGHRDCYEQITKGNAGDENPILNHQVPRLQAGGINVVIYAIGGDTIAHSNGMDRPLFATATNIDQFYGWTEGSPDVAVIRTADDLPTESDGRVHYVLHLEGGKPIEGSLSGLRTLYRLGLRSMQLTWNWRNEIGDGAMETRTGGGLTRFGVDVVKEMTRLGMLIDLAHISEASFWSALEVAEGPVVVTHGNSRALFDHPRNLYDQQARAVAETGGVVGVQVSPKYVHADEPTIDRMIDHFEHYLDVVGPDHVGFGADFGASDGPRPGRERNPFPRTHPHLEGLQEVDSLRNLTEGMLRRGIPEETVKKILGRNFLRVLGEVLPKGP